MKTNLKSKTNNTVKFVAITRENSGNPQENGDRSWTG